MRDIHHLGRTGAIAGGMTQVLNDYLAWSFPSSRQHVIVSRASRRVETVRRVASAWRAISRLDAPRDVVVGHVSQRGSFLREGALMVHARRRGLAVVAHVHGSSFPPFARAHPRLTRWALRSAHVIIVLSPETARAVADLGLGAEVRLIPNAVSSAPEAVKEPLVVFGGAVTRRKGVDTLLAAWADASLDGWELVVAGPLLEPDLASDLPVGARALGAIPRADLIDLLARASIAVLPSTDEAMPLFILEGMAARAAIIATPVGGIAEVLANGRGVIVPVGDASSLAAALRELAIEDTTRESIADAGHARWQSLYAPEAVIPQLEAAWERARYLADPGDDGTTPGPRARG